MAGTTVHGGTGPNVRETPAGLVYVKATWSDDWELRTDLDLVEVYRATGGQDLSRAVVRGRYGRVLPVGQTAFETPDAEDLARRWVRVDLAGREGAATVFVGRISSEARGMHFREDRASGVQDWVAYGGLQILRKAHLDTVGWYRDGAVLNLDWGPNFNASTGGRPAGNYRFFPGHWLFGGTDLWTRETMALYVLARIGEAGGPVWTLAGDLRWLEDATDEVPVRPGETAAEVLRRIIDPQRGVDFFVEPTDAGFEVRVYSLYSEAVSFGETPTVTLTPSHDAVRFNLTTPGAAAASSVKVVRTWDHRYARIRVIGERIVRAVTLTLDVEPQTLEAGWSDALEAEYKAALGDDAQENDAFRRSETFRDVYQTFRVKTDTMDCRAPKLSAEGEVQIGEYEDEAQTAIRETLPWLPLYTGVDYTVADPAAPDETAGLLKPLVWIYRVEPAPGVWIPADKAGVGVSVLETDWGFHLSTRPNHLLAGVLDWQGAANSMHRPRYNWRATMATLAFRTDHRLALEHVVDPDDATGEVLEVHVPGAECWVVDPNVYVRVDQTEDGDQVVRRTPAQVIVRNDAPRLAAVMAGLIARYGRPRSRAHCVFHDMGPWTQCLGKMLTAIESPNGGLVSVGGPVTSVRLSAYPEPRTELKAGFAL